MFLFATLLSATLGLLLCLVSIFLILLILIQRGRGGGLTGALGGPGGQSAFGTKAGDVFTRITAVTACIWIALCSLTILVTGGPELGGGIEGTTITSGEPLDGATGGMGGLPNATTAPPMNESPSAPVTPPETGSTPPSGTNN
jgi:preprotein translocase subunit SecG